MRMIDPTYLRTINDGLLSGAINKDNASALPMGLVGMYEAALPPASNVNDRKKLLAFFSVWALLKKEVDAEFVAPLLPSWTNDEVIKFIGNYSKWFNSPVSGKYVLYHERFRTFVLQKLSRRQFEESNNAIIRQCQLALKERLNNDWGRYALEHLSSHLLINAMESSDGSALKALAYDTTHWNRQIEISKGFEWSKSMLNDMMLWASKYDEDEVIECALNKVDLHHIEQNDASRIVQLVAENDIETALIRIEAFGGNDKEGIQRKFILYMLCLMELTLLDSKDKPFRKDAIERIIGFIFGGVMADKEFSVDVFPSDVLFELSLEWEKLKIDYRLFYQYKSNWDWELSIIPDLKNLTEINWFKVILPDFAMKCSHESGYWLYGNAIKILGEQITKSIYYEIEHSGGLFTRPLWLVNYYLRTEDFSQLNLLLNHINENSTQELLLEADLLVIEFKISNGFISDEEVPSELFEIGEILGVFKYQFVHSRDFYLSNNHLDELIFRYCLIAIQFDYEVQFILDDYLEVIEILIAREGDKLTILKNRVRFILLNLLSGSDFENLKIPLHDLVPKARSEDENFIWEIIWECDNLLCDYSNSKVDFLKMLKTFKKTEYLTFVKECLLDLSKCVKVKASVVKNIHQIDRNWKDDNHGDKFQSLLKSIEYVGVNCDSLSMFKLWIDDAFEREKTEISQEKERITNSSALDSWIFNLDLNSQSVSETDLVNHLKIEQVDLFEFKEELLAKDFEIGFEFIKTKFSSIAKEELLGYYVVLIKYSRRFRRVGYQFEIFDFITNSLNFQNVNDFPKMFELEDIRDFLYLYKYLLSSNLNILGKNKFHKNDPYMSDRYTKNFAIFFDYFEETLNYVIVNLTDCYPMFLNFVRELIDSEKFNEEINFLTTHKLKGLSWPFALQRKYCQFLIDQGNYIVLERAIEYLESLKDDNERNLEEFEKLILTIGNESKIQFDNAFFYQFSNTLYSDISRSNIIKAYILDLTISCEFLKFNGDIIRLSYRSFEFSECKEFRILLKLLPYKKIETNQIERMLILFYTNALGASLNLKFKNLEGSATDYDINSLDQTYLGYLIRLNQKWAIDIKNSMSVN